jgi:hypothetical protein
MPSLITVLDSSDSNQGSGFSSMESSLADSSPHPSVPAKCQYCDQDGHAADKCRSLAKLLETYVAFPPENNELGSILNEGIGSEASNRHVSPFRLVLSSADLSTPDSKPSMKPVNKPLAELLKESFSKY